MQTLSLMRCWWPRCGGENTSEETSRLARFRKSVRVLVLSSVSHSCFYGGKKMAGLERWLEKMGPQAEERVRNSRSKRPEKKISSKLPQGHDRANVNITIQQADMKQRHQMQPCDLTPPFRMGPSRGVMALSSPSAPRQPSAHALANCPSASFREKAVSIEQLLVRPGSSVGRWVGAKGGHQAKLDPQPRLRHSSGWNGLA